MEASSAEGVSSTATSRLVETEPTAAAWLRAIIETVGEDELTLTEIEQRVGELIVTPTSAPVEEYVDVLITEDVLAPGERDQHFRLTHSGRTLLEGVLSSPSAEDRQGTVSN